MESVGSSIERRYPKKQAEKKRAQAGAQYETITRTFFPTKRESAQENPRL
jgi:hypothetical protein